MTCFLEQIMPKRRKEAGIGCTLRLDKLVATTNRPQVKVGRLSIAVVVLLFIHGVLLAYSASRQSPTLNEPGHLVAGLSNWQFGRFELYRVNPPLVRMIAALPVLFAGYEADWSRFDDGPQARSERVLGEDFVAANAERSIWLFTIARWACVPISLIGGLFCFLWSRDFWQDGLAGLLSLTLWCFDPNILAHGALITPDCAAATFGLGAQYLFWRWLRQPTWPRAFAAGILLGIAEISKMTWIFLFVLWPVLWMFWIVTRPPRHPMPARRSAFAQLATILLIGIYCVNLCYGFDGIFVRLKDFVFVSKGLTKSPGTVGTANRFGATWLGEIPMPLPQQYLLGIDAQKADFDEYDRPSYLLGEWKHGGWPYYYLCSFAVKTTHGLQSILLLALFTLLYRWYRGTYPNGQCAPEPADFVLLLAPPLTVFALVSSQTAFNHHFRYVLPIFGFVFVAAGAIASWSSARPHETTLALKTRDGSKLG
jgi:hypothetical protein